MPNWFGRKDVTIDHDGEKYIVTTGPIGFDIKRFDKAGRPEAIIRKCKRQRLSFEIMPAAQARIDLWNRIGSWD